MSRFFNTTGPCDPRWHYMLPPESRSRDLLPFVQQQLYFVLHAARQTGKTTAMRAFAERLRGLGYAAVWATLEQSQGFDEVEQAEPLWLLAIERGAWFGLPEALRPPPVEPWLSRTPGSRLLDWLSAWSRALPSTPIVLLLDEADVVGGAALVSLLRQLRAGFMDRGAGRFPVSVGLIGMRDLRDYLTQARDGVPINPGSPFNVKAASITLRDFTRDEVSELYAQHTAETGQIFAPEALERAFAWTQGQPFLVNALASVAVTELAPDPRQPVLGDTIDRARDQLVLSRTTHLDSLAERLRDARVAPVIRALLLGDERVEYDTDDFQYVTDLGLVRRGPDGAEIANPLYREVLARQLSLNVQENLPRPRWRWQRPDGGLDMAMIIEQFLQFWRENADVIEEHTDRGYREAVPHLSFMGFLQKVVNGGGSVQREFAANRGRVDLLVRFAGERFVLELKRVPPTRRSLERVRQEGVEQLLGYLDDLGEREGWMLIFDQRPGRSWEDRLWREELVVDGRILRIFGA